MASTPSTITWSGLGLAVSLGVDVASDLDRVLALARRGNVARRACRVPDPDACSSRGSPRGPGCLTTPSLVLKRRSAVRGDAGDAARSEVARPSARCLSTLWPVGAGGDLNHCPRAGRSGRRIPGGARRGGRASPSSSPVGATKRERGIRGACRRSRALGCATCDEDRRRTSSSATSGRADVRQRVPPDASESQAVQGSRTAARSDFALRERMRRSCAGVLLRLSEVRRPAHRGKLLERTLPSLEIRTIVVTGPEHGSVESSPPAIRRWRLRRRRRRGCTVYQRLRRRKRVGRTYGAG